MKYLQGIVDYTDQIKSCTLCKYWEILQKLKITCKYFANTGQ